MVNFLLTHELVCNKWLGLYFALYLLAFREMILKHSALYRSFKLHNHYYHICNDDRFHLIGRYNYFGYGPETETISGISTEIVVSSSYIGILNPLAFGS